MLPNFQYDMKPIYNKLLFQLEDALLCQERLQVVLTEFRLKILKRKSKRNF